jgi:hypothetical protein
VKVDPAEPDHYFLNIALNSAAGVGYIADTNTRDVLVVRLDSGKLVDRIASPNSVAVLYNAARDEIYVTHRNDRRLASSTQNPSSQTHHQNGGHAQQSGAFCGWRNALCQRQTGRKKRPG